MSKKTEEEIKLGIDMLHYKYNYLSFWLIILVIVLNIAMFLIIYTTTDCIPNAQMGVDLLINVILMLSFFLAAEKTKRYDKKWAIISIVIGGIQILRIFWIPLYYFLEFINKQKGLSTPSFISCFILLLVGGGLMIFCGIYTLTKYKVLINNKPLLEVEEGK